MNLPSLRPSSHIWKSKASMYITEKPSSKAHTDNTRINTTRKSGKKKSRRRLMNPDLQMPSKKHTPRNAKLFSALSKSEQKNTINHHIMKQKSHKYYKFIDYVAKFWKKRLSLIHVHFFFLRVGLDEFLMLEATVVRWLHLNLCQTTLYKRSLENFITLSMSSFAATFSPIWPAIQKSFRHRNFHNEGKWGWAFKKKEIAGNNDSPQRAPALCP